MRPAVTVHADGSWTCPTDWPAHADHFWVAWDSDTLCDSMDDLVTGGSYGGDRLDVGLHLVGVYFWSDAVSFRFEVEAGKGRFIPCAGAN